MPFKNTENSYGSIAKCFHWLTAVLVISMLVYGCTLKFLEKGPLRTQLFYIHKSIGLLILMILVLRWIWRLLNKNPAVIGTQSPVFKKSIHAFHDLLYLVTTVMILSGSLMIASGHSPLPFFGLLEVPTQWFLKSDALGHIFSKIHYYCAWSLTGLLMIHIGAAFKHHFFNRDKTLKRMLSG